MANRWDDFMLKPELLRAIGEAGFDPPSEVQQATIPNAILGHDMIVQAKSGMGKTAVFVLAALSQIQPTIGTVDTLVLIHTREMAKQIYYEFDRFAKYMIHVQIGIVYGGVPFSESKRIIQSEQPHILIGTPGRVKHLLESKILSLNSLKRFIIDECDNMIQDIDLRSQIQEIFIKTPRKKQTMLFSATIEQKARILCRKFTLHPKEIYVNDRELTLHGMRQFYVRIVEKDKVYKLTELLDDLDFKQIVIFCKTRIRATTLSKYLVNVAFPSVCIHGEIEQYTRFRLFKLFKEYQYKILVTTDLFGRGIDLEKVNMVINYDMTQTTDEYLHRVGRAGRFGTKGTAITFESNDEELQIMQQIQERFKIKVAELPDDVKRLDFA